MSNINIKFDRPELSDADILKHKDFNALKSSFNGFTKPILKTTKFWVGLNSFLAVAIVASVLIFKPFQKENSNDMVINENESDSLFAKFIDQPFDSVDIAYEIFEVANNEGKVIITKSGSKITIPAGAFVDQNGNPVTGDVEINYREFHNVVDFFLSGIPMDYDSAGVKSAFVSAGMFEILAYQKDQPLNMQKDLTVDLVSYDDQDLFNNYYLDEENKKWEYLGRSEMEKINEEETSFTEDENTENIEYTVISEKKSETKNIKLTDLKTDNLFEPKMLNKSNYVFEMKDIPASLTELQPYRKDKNSPMLFEVDLEYCQFDPKLYQVQWEGLKLSKSNVKGHFTLSLIRKDSAVNLVVYPVFRNEEYYNAMEVYNKRQAEMEKIKNSQVSNNSSRIPVVRTQTAAQGIDELLSVNIRQANVYRRVVVDRPGVYNCDYPGARYMVQYKEAELAAEGHSIAPEFKDAQGNEIEYRNIYFVDKSKNSLFQFKNGENVRIRKNIEFVIWILTKDQKIAFIEYQVFKDKINESDQPTFYVKPMHPAKGVEELGRKIVGV